MERIKSDRIILENGIFDGFIYFEDGKITEVSVHEKPYSQEYDMTGSFVSAGFIDIHTHGGGGYPFEGTADDVIKGCNFHLMHGTTSICPTVSAARFESMKQSVVNIKLAMNDHRYKGTILGAHLEGPYLSQKQCGAQCTDYITKPKSNEYLPLLDEFSDYIARWSYAPENDSNCDFAKSLQKFGVVASAGHTDAVFDDMQKAAQYGCNLVTHLYSCTSTITRDHGFRRLGVIETAFLSDDMFVEIICDGKHLPPELIKLIYKIKRPEKIALVTDSLVLAGTELKHGFMQSTEFIIEDGVCKLMDRSAFAGSIATADRLVRVAVKEAGLPLVEAVKMITKTPADIMKLSHKGRMKVGCDADFAVFDDDINVKTVFANGQKIDTVF